MSVSSREAGARAAVVDAPRREGYPVARRALRWIVLALGLHLAAWLGRALATEGGRAPRSPLWVELPADADANAQVRAIERAVLEEEGRRLGLVRSDPVIRGRLAMDLRFLRGQPSFAEEEVPVPTPAELAEALALGLDRHDPVIAARLVAEAERRLVADVASLDPGDLALATHRQAHPARFARAARMRFEERFFASARDDPEGDARRALAALTRGEGDSSPQTAGDPRVLALGDHGAGVDELDRRLGAGFGANLAALPRGRWGGPLRSAFGVHLVRVAAGPLPAEVPLAVVREEVLASWRAEERSRRRRIRLDELRRRYDVRLREPSSDVEPSP